VWLYKTAVKQNLEYLADHHAVERTDDIKSYQYLMLRQAVNKPEYALSNSFYNSLIKKRIVMLNQNQSKRINVLKTFLVLPLLGLFLVSFSVENVYQYQSPDGVLDTMDDKTIELMIDKNTMDAELDKFKKDLAKDGFDFSYTTVRNSSKEIIGISVHLSGKNSKGEKLSGQYNTESDDPIKPFTIFYDDEANTVSFGNVKHFKFRTNDDNSLETDKIHWKSDDETEIVIKNNNSNKVVIVDGKRLSDEEVEEMEIEKGTSIFISTDEDGKGMNKRIKVKKLEKDGNHVTIVRDSDDEEDIEVIGDDNSFFYIDNDGKGEPLYFIDGKKATAKEVRSLTPASIESMNVYKGDKATKKYGKKAKNGVVEITTKKE
ncbi:MAG: M56 family peptidase, partial [Muricauda sp.]|nr:M56 family peptidase [Allomuricauda sp.]